MKVIHLTLTSPALNIAFDEALLYHADSLENFKGILRFWESPIPFVVLGQSGKTNEEVHLNNCRKLDIPILRRISGGGTVLQGPGCLSYSLIMPIIGMHHRNLTTTTDFIMQTHSQCLRNLGLDVSIQGVSDLTLNNLKFSGNAQRRLQKTLLFHGTFLYKFNINSISNFLPIPAKKPEYRNTRDHSAFLTNLPISKEQITKALTEAWNAQSTFPLQQSLLSEAEKLNTERYSKEEWNFKF